MVIDDKATAINALIDAVQTIERVLGITPNGVYADIRVRLDILEARINNPYAPAPNVTNPFYIDGYGGVSISVGDGYPTESRLDGSLYLRRDGYIYEGLYSHRDGVWNLIPTDFWRSGGDLSGDYYTQTVIGIQNRSVSDAAPTDGYHLTWNNGDGYWEPQIGFFASKDLSGTKIEQTVIGIQGNPISSSIPVDGYTLIWQASSWTPTRLPIIFDPSYESQNIVANRPLDQSPIDNTKVGIVNLASSNLLTGVSGDYSTSVGGYRNSVTADYSSVVGGLNNSISSSYSVISSYSAILGGATNSVSSIYGNIVGGSSNTVRGEYSSIIGGQGNVASAQYTSVLSGEFNTADGYLGVVINGSVNKASGSASIVINGLNNTVLGDVSSVINGTLNQISGNYSAILTGYQNQISGTDSVVLLGTGNAVNYQHSIVAGENNTADSNYAFIHGDLNNISTSSDYSHVDGYANATSAPHTLVRGYAGSGRVAGQEIHAMNYLTTAGDEQYSRILLSGSQINGGQFDLTIPNTVSSVAMEDGKSYDMCVRILIVNTTGTPTCARFVYDILAHQESSTLTLDETNLTLATDNGTSWTTTITTSGDELIVRVDTATVGADDRRAFATVEWRELSRI